MTTGEGRFIGVRVEIAAAEALERDDPELVLRVTNEVRTAAEGDLRAGVPRGVAYIRRLQEVTLRRPELGIAVARALNLSHIVEDLLEGASVEGVPGIGTDGVELSATRRHKIRVFGKSILAFSVVVLLIDAVIGDGVATAVLYAWTAVGLGLFFVGTYLVMLRE
jgi:hypothetical protein